MMKELGLGCFNLMTNLRRKKGTSRDMKSIFSRIEYISSTLSLCALLRL